jgi:hypothetical protein
MIRVYIFIIGLAIITVGFIGQSRIDEQDAMGLLIGSLTLGGGIIICGAFSFKMLWHGVTGAGVLALLSFGRGLFNLPDAAKYIVGDRIRGHAPMFELAVTILSALLLTRILAAWKRERMRTMLEESHKGTA